MAEKKDSESKKGFSYTRTHTSERTDAKLDKKISDFAEKYKKFLSTSKTEEECVDYATSDLKKSGFSEIDIFSEEKVPEKFFLQYDNRVVIAGNMNGKDFKNGVTFVMTHIDSPRIDTKPLSLYEKSGFGVLKTQYYGGIKKYQWVTIPLALHGSFFLESGKEIKISIGEKEDEPVFTISDLLPHLGQEQMKKEGRKVIEAEDLNVIVSSLFEKEESGKQDKKKSGDKFKEFVLGILNEKYGISEEDFISADLKFVPAGAARDLGFDRSMIFGYGHDDRSCSFAAIEALKDAKKSSRPVIMLWVDKEEIGSEGSSSIQSNLLRTIISKLLLGRGISPTEFMVSSVLGKSHAISGDVDAVSDPTHSSVDELLNTAKINSGVILTKYTGYGGKYSTNDATGRYVAQIRQILNSENVHWQPGLLGKTDAGGGGTIAKYLARHMIQTVDMGPGVLSMHAPYEVISKADLFATYHAYRAFFEKCE